MSDFDLSRRLELALGHHRAGRLAPAEALYREILDRHPECVDALHYLGVIAHQRGDHQTAVELIARAAVAAPNHPTIHSNLGEAYRHLHRLDEAITSFRRGLALQPNRPDTLNNLGLALDAQGRLHVAIDCFRRALEISPGFGNAHYNLGAALNAAGRPTEALPHFLQAVALNPGSAELHCDLGALLAQQGRLDEALACFHQALALAPNLAKAHNNLASLFKERREFDLALPCYERALALQSDLEETHNNLGNLFLARGQVEDALACFRRARSLAPARADFQSNIVLALHYRPERETRQIETELRRWQQHYATPVAAIRPHSNERAPNRPLRLGYVSPDFRLHAVAFFLLPLLEAHDRSQFHITCYSTTLRSDTITARFRANAAQWCNLVGVPDNAAAEKIRADHIDLLIDLSGHMADNRLTLFARKPAPIQISYLGFPGSTGLEAMDYRLTDVFSDPADGPVGFHTEDLMRLPETAWCFTPLSGSPPVVSSPAARNGRVTFGCFNNFIKITDEVLGLWAKILQRLPHSRLVVKNPALGTPSVVQRLRNFFAARGIAATRVTLIPHQVATVDHLRCYNEVDIALDTFPYHGTTTTCEALWMGVPVITLCGATHVSRVGVSLLTNVGLAEFIADSAESYVTKAVAAASDSPRLAALRAALRERLQRSPIMDAPRLARNVEAVYRTMWHRWCASPTP